MKKSLPRKKSVPSTEVPAVKVTAVRKKKVASRQKPDTGISCANFPVEKTKMMMKKTTETKVVTPKKQRSSSPKTQKLPTISAKNKKIDTSHQPSTSLSENNPPMISLKEGIKQESLTYFEEPAVSFKTRPRKKGTRKKNGRLKAIHNRSFCDPDEVDFELEDQEFLDDELISLEEFDAILNETKGKAVKKRNFEEEDDEIGQVPCPTTETCRKDLSHGVGPGKPGRRKKVQRRRQIDPTTCERDYTTDEVEFMTALDEYKRNSGRMFPTCSEILEVLLGLGYTKVTPVSQEVPAAEEQTVVTEPIPTVGAEFRKTQTLTLTVDNFTTGILPTVTAVSSEYHQEYLPFFLKETLSVIEMSTLPEGFSV